MFSGREGFSGQQNIAIVPQPLLHERPFAIGVDGDLGRFQSLVRFNNAASPFGQRLL